MSLDQKRTHRPIHVTFLVWLIMFTTLWNGLRLFVAIRFRDALEQYRANPGTWYLTVCAGFWLLTGLVLILGILRGRSWAWFATLGFTVGYGFWYWFDRLVLQKPHANWPFGLFFTFISLALFTFLLFSKKTMVFFAVKYPYLLRIIKK
jgi:hypothetical protein